MPDQLFSQSGVVLLDKLIQQRPFLPLSFRFHAGLGETLYINCTDYMT